MTFCWKSSEMILSLGALSMIGPQLYELSRMCHFRDIRDLHEFAEKREQHGVQRWMPVILICTDGIISLLPGTAILYFLMGIL